MAFFDFIFSDSRKKSYLLTMQKIIMENSPNRLVMSEKQLYAAAREQAQNDVRSIQDSLPIVSETTNPDAFFPRLEMLQQLCGHLMLLEPYVPFSGASPSEAYYEFVTEKDKAIMLFLKRYYDSIQKKSERMKTEREKANQYITFCESLRAYYPQMNNEHLEYIKSCMQYS